MVYLVVFDWYETNEVLFVCATRESAKRTMVAELKSRLVLLRDQEKETKREYGSIPGLEYEEKEFYADYDEITDDMAIREKEDKESAVKGSWRGTLRIQEREVIA